MSKRTKLRKASPKSGPLGLWTPSQTQSSPANVLSPDCEVLACGNGAIDTNGPATEIWAICYDPATTMNTSTVDPGAAEGSVNDDGTWNFDDFSELVPEAACGTTHRPIENQLAVWAVMGNSSPPYILTNHWYFWGVCSSETDTCNPPGKSGRKKKKPSPRKKAKAKRRK